MCNKIVVLLHRNLHSTNVNGHYLRLVLHFVQILCMQHPLLYPVMDDWPGKTANELPIYGTRWILHPSERYICSSSSLAGTERWLGVVNLGWKLVGASLQLRIHTLWHA